MRKIAILIIMLLSFQTALFAANEEDQKLQELEKRIKELEQKLERGAANKKEIEELRRQIAILAEEIEKLRAGEDEAEFTETERRSLGLGPSAASVYRKKQGVSIAGYGEMLYENFSDETDAGAPSGRSDQLDFLRAIVYFGYRFSDRFLFNSEIEVEHSDEISVEFAHIDYLLNDDITVRGGMVLVPMGFVNEFHEPTVFLGAKRPITETVIIPSTWRENGVGILGRAGIVDYRAYLINGFDASGFNSSGLRGGRQGGGQAGIESPSFVGRVDVTPTPGLFLGGSIFAGQSQTFSTPSADVELTTVIGEGHLEYRYRGLQFRALYARASLDNVTALNDALGLTGNASVGETMQGGYLQAGYNVLLNDEGSALTPYLRYESINTQSEVPGGFSVNPAREQTVWTIGVELRPIFNVVVKTDYQFIENEADSGVDQFNILLGYSF